MPTPRCLAEDAQAIWHTGVAAVRSEKLIHDAIHRNANELAICGRKFSIDQLRRIVVVGGGKAGAGMAAAVEEALGDDLTAAKVAGVVNVPADCVRPLRAIRLNPARPAGVNEPTPAGVLGASEMLHLVRGVDACDLCLVLLSGGGSALLPAPVPEISLADKLETTRFLSASGATIGEMNAVRKKLSLIKGGGLAQAMQRGAMLALIISDVVGDPLDVIASGPTVADSTTVAEAIDVLQRFGAAPPAVPQPVFDFLHQLTARGGPPPIRATVENHLIGNNAMALAAAKRKAVELGYVVQLLGSANQGEAETEGRLLARQCWKLRETGRAPICVLSGGEPVVRLSRTDRPRKGGRNQHLVLAACDELWSVGMEGLCLLSGGTDGEDGPTDAAGAWIDARVIAAAHAAGIAPRDDLAIHNAYHFFETAGGLFKTGPTHTNVMDLRVAVIA